jgi:hypothetical protein
MRVKLLVTIVTLLLLTACASNPTVGADGEVTQARELADRIEFDDDEYGCAEIRGEVSLSPIPWFGSTVDVVIKKVKPAPDGSETPQC